MSVNLFCSFSVVMVNATVTQFERARACTDSLFDLVAAGGLYSRPIAERHPLIFYLGHLEAFDWNKICRWALGVPAFHATFDRLFEAGIDPEPGTAVDGVGDWPRVEEIREYGRRTRETIDRVLADAPAEIIHMALEHRWMHYETLAYLLHALPYEQKLRAPQAPVESGAAPVAEMMRVAAGSATMGQQRGVFGWDNEFDAHTVAVPGFGIGKYKVTNGDYLRFVEEGGAASAFWTAKAGDWFYRGMFEAIPLPLNWPVYVTHEQASAFAAWAGKRLPTEAEFHRAAYREPIPAAGFERWDPGPVADEQMVGNGWEWTSTVFHPFAGFEASPAYPGYSRDFFDGKHYVLKGASPRTADCFLRTSFRNWFRPNYPYVYSAFRLAED